MTMKRKILVLDAFTNGHEAALAFIKRQDWAIEECEIIFCGTHAKLLSQLSEGPSYAVIPVTNSIAGEVTEVTTVLSKLRDMGYELPVRDTLDLHINHYLLAPRHIHDPLDLEQVMTHEKAFQQCGLYLDTIGITHEQRARSTSTGNAAKAISKLGLGAKIGAIASRAAAEEYGLNILAAEIQDVADNKTTFLLLENESAVKSVTVGIIGIDGGFGRLLKGFFESLGCPVIGSDAKNPAGHNNAEVVERSDVVIFSVPIRDTPVVIRSLLPHIREDQLLMDVTSIKQPAVEAMLESPAQIVGLHPMFRPEVSFDGQTVVVCPARLISPYWKTWLVNVLSATRARLKWSTAVEHDAYMLMVQVIPHLGNLTHALMLTETKTSVAESLEFTSPFYRIMFSLMGRLVSQNPGLYASIVMENPESLTMLERRIEIEQRLAEMIRNQDQTAFERLFTQARDHFGPDVTDAGQRVVHATHRCPQYALRPELDHSGVPPGIRPPRSSPPNPPGIRRPSGQPDRDKLRLPWGETPVHHQPRAVTVFRRSPPGPRSDRVLARTESNHRNIDPASPNPTPVRITYRGFLLEGKSGGSIQNILFRKENETRLERFRNNDKCLDPSNAV